MIRGDGWGKYSIWEHSARIKELYKRRCQLLEEEMTCAAQAAELLTSRVSPGDSLLDVGCGSGYFFHSLQSRGIGVEYFGVDATPGLIDIGRQVMPAYGLAPERLEVLRIEDLDARVDHVVCMNVLSNLDNYHRPLERLLLSARKTLILRESLHAQGSYAYVRDEYLDPGAELRVYVNTYPLGEVCDFITGHGYRVSTVEDRRSRGKPEMVIGYPHYWTFLVADRDPARPGSLPR